MNERRNDKRVRGEEGASEGKIKVRRKKMEVKKGRRAIGDKGKEEREGRVGGE